MQDFKGYLTDELLPGLIFSILIWLYYRNKKVSVESKYETFWPRFFALCIDFFVLSPIPLLFLLFQSNIKILKELIEFLDVYIDSLYFILMHAVFSQTIGKMICKVKVVDNKTENPISYKQAIVRDIFPIVVGLVFVLTFNLFRGYFPNISENYYIGIALVVCVLWYPAEIFTMLMNSKRRSIHDYIAGTVVIRTNTSAEIEKYDLNKVLKNS